MSPKWTTVIFVGTLLLYSASARFVDSLDKCAVDDSKCLEGLIHNIIQDIGKGGIEEYNIAPVDPFDLKDIKVPIDELLKIKVEEGEARGIRDCVISNVVSDPKERRFGLEVTCDLDIGVKVKLDDISSQIQKTFGTDALNGGGNAKVKLEKLHLKVEFSYDLIKRDDGETYIVVKPKETVYEYTVEGAKITTDKFLFGDKDASKDINEFLKQNEKIVINTFGKSFLIVAFEILNNLLTTFFDKTPTKYFITTDLSPYL